MREQRRHERIPIEVEVEIAIPGLFRRQRRILRTRDVSHGGAFVVGDGRASPPVGSEIEIRLTGLVEGQAPPVVRAKVVRVTAEGMAIAFLAPT
jgi:c-di-GMP-binding flagellar brake protein YcgR